MGLQTPCLGTFFCLVQIIGIIDLKAHMIKSCAIRGIQDNAVMILRFMRLQVYTCPGLLPVTRKPMTSV
jgi:hypothetical protein